jgi:hypothetical protein
VEDSVLPPDTGGDTSPGGANEDTGAG